MATGTVHILVKQAASALSLSSTIMRETGLTSCRVSDLISIGAVYVRQAEAPADSRPRRVFAAADSATTPIDGKDTLSPGSYIRVHTNPKMYTNRLKSVDWESRIVSTAEEYVVVNKPGGVPSTPAVRVHVHVCLFSLSLSLALSLALSHTLSLSLTHTHTHVLTHTNFITH